MSFIENYTLSIRRHIWGGGGGGCKIIRECPLYKITPYLLEDIFCNYKRMSFIENYTLSF